MITFEEKAKKINNLIKSSKGKEDNLILKTLFSMIDIEKPKIKKTDNVENLSNNDLYYKFFPYQFNHSTKYELLPYFQEVYNRTVTEAGYEPRYKISYNKDADFKPYGQTSCYSNEIIINYSFISKMKKKDFDLGIDRHSISTASLITLLHETEHTLQYERALDFASGNDNSTKNAMYLLELISKSYCLELSQNPNNTQEEKDFLLKVSNSYAYSFLEHDANVTSFDLSQNLIKSEYLRVYDNAISKKARKFLGYNLFDGKIDDYIEKAEEMQSLFESYANFIDEHLENGEIKNKMLSTVNNYLKKDSKGNSKFKNDLIKDYQRCISYTNLSKIEISKKENESMQLV